MERKQDRLHPVCSESKQLVERDIELKKQKRSLLLN
jgi:hypothetical protein